MEIWNRSTSQGEEGRKETGRSLGSSCGKGEEIRTLILQITVNHSHAFPTHRTTLISVQVSHPLNTSPKPYTFACFLQRLGRLLPNYLLGDLRKLW